MEYHSALILAANREKNVTINTIAPDSTFGQAWAELADALESEPFKSFAEAKSIDISKLVINPAGRLSEIKNGRPVDLHVQHDFDWPAASSAVLAAARMKKVPERGPLAPPTEESSVMPGVCST